MCQAAAFELATKRCIVNTSFIGEIGKDAFDGLSTMFQQIDQAAHIPRSAVKRPGPVAPSQDRKVAWLDKDGKFPRSGARPEISVDELVFTVIAAFRGHGHINNVLTHISGGNWVQVEQALRVILDPCARSRDISPLARNIIDLMCADRGVTGRIVKPFYRELLAAVLGQQMASHLVAHVTALFQECERPT
jgi:hypothetical protein